jgi:hypothetical protein
VPSEKIGVLANPVLYFEIHSFTISIDFLPGIIYSPMRFGNAHRK